KVDGRADAANVYGVAYRGKESTLSRRRSWRTARRDKLLQWQLLYPDLLLLNPSRVVQDLFYVESGPLLEWLASPRRTLGICRREAARHGDRKYRSCPGSQVYFHELRPSEFNLAIYYHPRDIKLKSLRNRIQAIAAANVVSCEDEVQLLVLRGQ